MKGEFQIIKNIGKLSDGEYSVSKEISIMKWYNATFIDIRKWSEQKPQKGIALNLYEAKKLLKLLPIAISSLEHSINNKNIVEDNISLEDITDDEIT